MRPSWIRFLSFGAWLLLLLLVVVVVVVSAEDECSLYLAPSSIPNAGLGIFTAKTVKRGHTFQVGDVLIPTMDVLWHNYHRSDPVFWVLDDYVWHGSVMGMHREVHTENVDAYAPGLDCAINCHLALINVKRGVPQYDNLLHRKDSPGSGAITPYSNASTIVAQTIPAGGELFKFYGDSWFETRPSYFGEYFPLSTDYAAATALAKRFHRKFTKNHSPETLEDLYGLVVNFGYESRTLNAMPQNTQELQQTIELGIRSLHQPSAIRDNLHTLPEARCIDLIRAGPSTIPHAGRGAFATRSIAKGQVITGSPLLHMPDASVLDMYNETLDDQNYKVPDKLINKQILLNYCWGHEESTVLLCPYGPGITLMNHAKEDANVGMEWPPDGQAGHTSSWLDREVEQLYEYSPHLGMDFVALRDIQEGEELLVDYGNVWQEAWDEHVASWKPVEDDHVSAAQFNAERLEAVPPNLQMVCDEDVWYEKRMRRTKRYQDIWDVTNDGYPCEIVARNDKDDTFTVNIYDFGSDEPIEATNVPRNYISFRDYPETTDMHLPNVFRHAAQIPDHLFPNKWKNLKQEHHDEL